jgi:hypothetical protein
MRSLFTLLVSLGLCTAPALARELEVEVQVLHIGGLLSAAELEAMLADPRLGIEAGYQPARLIDGVTARRERTMPIGSKLFAIPQTLALTAAQIERNGRTLRFKVPEGHPAHDSYRLNDLTLRTPVSPGIGRPQPDLRIDLLNPVPKSGADDQPVYGRYGVFDLGLRLRYRWGNEQHAAKPSALICHADVHATGDGQYRFRPRHRAAGLFRFYASVVQSNPPSRPPAGQRSQQMREPFPEPLTGWKLSRNHLVQFQIAGLSVERLSVYGEQAGPGPCRRTLGYEALFADGKPVTLQRSLYEDSCKGADTTASHNVEAEWLDDGKLARYVASTQTGSQSWDGFAAAADARCAVDPAPSAAEVQALQTELQRIRTAFLRP